MKKFLITDFLDKDDDHFPREYLELPIFKKNFTLNEKDILFRKSKNYKIKISERKKNFELYEYFLTELTKFLNDYHKKNYSKRYWSILLGQWLFRFISAVSFRWNLIKSLKNEYIFIKKKIFLKDTIPLGIEDYVKISNSNYWNNYIYAKIIKHSFQKKIKIKQDKKILKNHELEDIYIKLKNKNFNDYLSLHIQKFLNFFSKNSKTLIFSSYMSNLQEIKLSFLINKSLQFYKLLRPYYLFRNKALFEFNRKNLFKLKSHKKGLENFLSKEILNSLPTAYLENYDKIEKIVNFIPFPKSPKKIFTTLGINRNSLLDRYIAKNVEKGSSLILSQHGGVYFQHKYHFSSVHELRISDKYLSWGKIKDKKVIPVGIIKNLKNKDKKSNRILLEVRKRTGYVGEIKTDSGYLENRNYNKTLCNFFSLIKGQKFSENLFIKLHEMKSFWREKEQFLSHNSKLKFLNDKANMIKEINSAQLIIHTYCGTGHLESLSINKPTLILFIHDLNLLNDLTKSYYRKFIKLGIVHNTSKSLFDILKKLNSEKKINKWWNSKKRQNLLKKYTEDFGFYNKNKIEDIRNIIMKS